MKRGDYPEHLPYRQLYYAIRDYEGGALYDDVLRVWLGWQDEQRRWLDGLRHRPGDPTPSVTDEESWELYALSRVVDVLNLSFAPREGDGWKMPKVDADEMAAFMGGLGIEPIGPRPFHPVFHEIVTVEQADGPFALPEVVREYWPGWRLGGMIVSRAGCAVRAGREHMVKEVAEDSRLYWAYARHTRPTEDLSAGWGSNSQWRTQFRRDYEIGGAVWMNVDAHGRKSPFEHNTEFTAAERQELVRHRCLVRTPQDGREAFPYELTHVETL